MEVAGEEGFSGHGWSQGADNEILKYLGPHKYDGARGRISTAMKSPKTTSRIDGNNVEVINRYFLTRKKRANKNVITK